MDEEGIERIAGYCTRYPGLIVLLDSYHALTSRLGLQECDASFADPCIDLTEALAPHEATLLLIHHAKNDLVHCGPQRPAEATTLYQEPLAKPWLSRLLETAMTIRSLNGTSEAS